MSWLKILGLCGVFAVAAVSCGGPRGGVATSAQESASGLKTNAPAAQIFEVKGVVKKLDPDGRTVVVKHEEIRGYMQAMTMPFTAKNTNDLRGLAEGDEIAFQLHVTPDDGWIEKIVKTGAANVIPDSGPGGLRRTREVEPLAVGDPMPNYTFTNELGQLTRLDQFKGQALALTFIFTRCPFPTFCPRMSARFAEAAQKLMAQTNGPTNWHFLSITIDPEFDTPARLKAYAKTYRSDPAKWSFLTGGRMDLDAITGQFGLEFAYDKGTINHKLRTVVIGADGKIRQIYLGNEWQTGDLAAEITQAAAAPASEAKK